MNENTKRPEFSIGPDFTVNSTDFAKLMVVARELLRPFYVTQILNEKFRVVVDHDPETNKTKVSYFFENGRTSTKKL